MTASPLRIGIVGAGSNTRSRHIPGLQAIDGVEVVAVANRGRASGERAAAQFNIPTVYDHWGALLDDESIDAVCIGAWPNLHCPVTLAALARGKHVLVEARLAMDLAEAKEMLAAARAHPELVTQVVPAPFSFEVDRTIQQLIAGGYLGDLLAVDMRLGGASFVDRDAPITFRDERQFSGLNTMMMGIWYETLLRWTPGVTRVMAHSRVVVPARRDPETGEQRAADVPDHVEVIGEMNGGAAFHMQASAVTGLNGPLGIWLFGTEGTLCYQHRDHRLLGGRRGDSTLAPIDIPPEQQARWRVEAEFVGAIRGEEPVRFTTFADGVRYMAFTDAVARSAAESRLVAVEYP